MTCGHCAARRHRGGLGRPRRHGVEVDVETGTVVVARRRASPTSGARGRRRGRLRGGLSGLETPRPPGRARPHVDLLVGGMTCASCVGRVEKKLNRLDGRDARPSTWPPRPRRSTSTPGGRRRHAGAAPSSAPATPPPSPRRTAPRGRLRRGAADRRGGLPAPAAGRGAADRRRARADDGSRRSRDTAAVRWVGAAAGHPGRAVRPAGRSTGPRRVNARHGASTMDTLVSLGTLVAYGWSVVPGGDRRHAQLRRGRRDRHHVPAARPVERGPREAAGRLGAARAARARAPSRRPCSTRTAPSGWSTSACSAPGCASLVRPGEQVATDGVVVEGRSGGRRVDGHRREPAGRQGRRRRGRRRHPEHRRPAGRRGDPHRPRHRAVARIADLVAARAGHARRPCSGWPTGSRRCSSRWCSASPCSPSPSGRCSGDPTRRLHRRGGGAGHRLPLRPRPRDPDRAARRHRPGGPARHRDPRGRGAGVDPRAIDTVVLDKTGTVTTGGMSVHEVVTHHAEAVRLAGALEACQRAPGRPGDRGARRRAPARSRGRPRARRSPTSTSHEGIGVSGRGRRPPRPGRPGALRRHACRPPGARRPRSETLPYALAQAVAPPARPAAPPCSSRSTTDRRRCSTSATPSRPTSADAVRRLHGLGLRPGAAHRGPHHHGAGRRRRGRDRRGGRRGDAGRQGRRRSTRLRAEGRRGRDGRRRRQRRGRAGRRPTSASRWAPAPRPPSRPAT